MGCGRPGAPSEWASSGGPSRLRRPRPASSGGASWGSPRAQVSSHAGTPQAPGESLSVRASTLPGGEGVAISSETAAPASGVRPWVRAGCSPCCRPPAAPSLTHVRLGLVLADFSEFKHKMWLLSYHMFLACLGTSYYLLYNTVQKI